MGVSRYDKNADQLCQIVNHLRSLKHYNNKLAEAYRENMITMLLLCLDLNNDLGKLDEKGLI